MGREDFPNRDDAGALFSNQYDFPPVVTTPTPQPWILPILGKLPEWIAKAGEQIDKWRPTVPDFPWPDTTEQNEADDCPALALALRQLTVEVARLTETTRAGHAAQATALWGINEQLAAIRQTLTTRLPHREFTVAAQIDLQHHIRDGFDSLCVRIAQVCEAATGVKVKPVDLPELRYTSPYKDRPEFRIPKPTIWGDEKTWKREG